MTTAHDNPSHAIQNSRHAYVNPAQEIGIVQYSINLLVAKRVHDELKGNKPRVITRTTHLMSPITQILSYRGQTGPNQTRAIQCGRHSGVDKKMQSSSLHSRKVSAYLLHTINDCLQRNPEGNLSKTPQCMGSLEAIRSAKCMEHGVGTEQGADVGKKVSAQAPATPTVSRAARSTKLRACFGCGSTLQQSCTR